MRAVPVQLHVDEAYFFATVRVLRALPGVAVKFDLNEVTQPKLPKPPKNGADQAKVLALPRPMTGKQLSPVIIELLAERPMTRAELVLALKERGLPATRVDQALYFLKLKGISKKNAADAHALTAEGRKSQQKD